MLFAIDIDGTIAHDEHGRAYARYLNRVLDLDIADGDIEHLPSYRAFVHLPEVQAYALQGEEHRQCYAQATKAAQHDPDVQRAVIPVAGAVEGVATLTHYGPIIYVTCRKPESRTITQQWLARYSFPQPERVYFCEHYHHKYLASYTFAASDEPIILIDDHAQDIIAVFKRLIKEHYPVAKSLYRRLAIVAYGSKQVPPTPPKLRIPVLALASWDKEAFQYLIEGGSFVPA